MSASEETTWIVHVHAPKPTEVRASENQNCPARARDGRRCGGRRLLIKYTPWIGVSAACYHCGALFDDGGFQTAGRANVERVRKEWRAIKEQS